MSPSVLGYIRHVCETSMTSNVPFADLQVYQANLSTGHTMSKLTFVLVHGAFHRPIVWSSVVSELDKAGYAAVAPGLPSSDPDRRDPPVPDNS